MRLIPLLLVLATACRPTDPGTLDEDGDGITAATDCNDADAAVFPGAPELCDGVDNDCSGVIDDAPDTETTTFYADGDGDGYGHPTTTTQACDMPTGYVADAGDCNDNEPDIHPGADEPDCTDPIDYNCDGSVGYADADADGVAACHDCDDTNAQRNPSAIELCNGADDNCDGDIDEATAADAPTWHADADADGFGDAATSFTSCAAGTGQVADATDCDDGAATVRPGADELCNSVDDNCNGVVDEAAIDQATWYADRDADGHGDAQATTTACAAPTGFVASSDDCNDLAATALPGGTEHCDGLDNDCDGGVDLGASDAPTWYADADLDGYGALAGEAACAAPQGAIARSGDCDDAQAAAHPGAPELCDGLDNDCNSLVDDSPVNPLTWYPDADGDGYGANASSGGGCVQPAKTALRPGDCDDTKASTNPVGVEVCDGADNNCDGGVDEGVTNTYFIDGDGDGHGDMTTTRAACAPPSPRWVTSSDDCDDLSASDLPGGTEVCDGRDNDCNQLVDDNLPLIDFWADLDADGYGDPNAAKGLCQLESPYIDNSGDCNDGDPNISPAAVDDTCDGVDQDCSGADTCGNFHTSWVLQVGTKEQYTRCESIANGGLTCNNPEIRYGTVTGGIPYEHSGNNFNKWCQQLGFAGNTAVTYGSRACNAPLGQLFGCTSYDETTWHWCDWQDGYWYNQNLAHHSCTTRSITSITCHM